MTGGNLAIIATGPVAVALVFAVTGAPGAALVAALGGVIGVAFYLVVGRNYDELESSRRREAELKTSLADLQVAQERIRIARDLHDGVAAELAALLWRARVLAHDEGEGPSQSDMLGFERRVLSALDQLRDVVLCLRGEPLTWSKATSLLSERSRDLCQDLALDFITDGEMDTEEHAMLWTEVEHIVAELVRNAARHAEARRVEVRIRAGSGELQVDVSDDGHGMQSADWQESQGGLANVRVRAEALCGSMVIDSRPSGTRVEVRLPIGRNEGPVGGRSLIGRSLPFA